MVTVTMMMMIMMRYLFTPLREPNSVLHCYRGHDSTALRRCTSPRHLRSTDVLRAGGTPNTAASAPLAFKFKGTVVVGFPAVGIVTGKKGGWWGQGGAKKLTEKRRSAINVLTVDTTIRYLFTPLHEPEFVLHCLRGLDSTAPRRCTSPRPLSTDLLRAGGTPHFPAIAYGPLRQETLR